jgi:hypothetical protein
MSLGEKIALARRAHRPLFKALIETGDAQILTALLDNSRLVENDVLVVLNSLDPPKEFFHEVLKHHRWGNSYEVKRTLAQSAKTPLPLALSALVHLRPIHIRTIAVREAVPQKVRDAALMLSARMREKEREGEEEETDR